MYGMRLRIGCILAILFVLLRSFSNPLVVENAAVKSSVPPATVSVAEERAVESKCNLRQ